ncbi:MAG: hypothetical protein P1U34_05470 [Coxiellaceae bacterium]|nr:hypothetical protein [Coxiellaceae bacterium]
MKQAIDVHIEMINNMKRAYTNASRLHANREHVVGYKAFSAAIKFLEKSNIIYDDCKGKIYAALAEYGFAYLDLKQTQVPQHKKTSNLFHMTTIDKCSKRRTEILDLLNFSQNKDKIALFRAKYKQGIETINQEVNETAACAETKSSHA